MSDRRKKIQGGIFNQTHQLPERDSEELTQRMHGQRAPEELAEVDRQMNRRDRSRFGSFSLTDTGLLIEEGATQSDWQEAGDYIFAFQGAVQWLIGDWIAFGERREWGELKKIAKERGCNYASLRQYVYVSRNVSMRIDNLSWNHHLLVAKLDAEKQQEALQQASENHWSLKDFRLWLRGGSPAPLLTGGPVSVKEARGVIKEIAKMRQKSPDLSRDKDKQLARGYIATLRKFIEDQEEWIEQGGAGEAERGG